MVISRARRPLALTEAMCRSGSRISTSAVVWMSAAVTSAGPRLSRRRITGPGDSDRRTRSFRLRMMSVTSSFTPGDDGEFVEGVVEAHLGDRRARDGGQQGPAEAVAERVAEARLERGYGKALAVAFGLAERLDR